MSLEELKTERKIAALKGNVDLFIKLDKQINTYVEESKVLDKHLKCPKCNTLLVKNRTWFVEDYCPKCKDTLAFVMDTKTGKGKQVFFKESIKLNEGDY